MQVSARIPPTIMTMIPGIAVRAGSIRPTDRSKVRIRKASQPQSSTKADAKTTARKAMKSVLIDLAPGCWRFVTPQNILAGSGDLSHNEQREGTRTAGTRV